MNHKQAEYTLISFSAGFLLYLMFTSANIANRQKILNPPRLFLMVGIMLKRQTLAVMVKPTTASVQISV